jgi:hypothetical protein
MVVQPLIRAMLGCGLGLVLTAQFALGQPDPVKPPNPPLAEGLRHVPPDALGFVHFRAGDFLKSPHGTSLLAALKLDLEAARGLQKLEQRLGMELADIESVTLILLPPPAYLGPRAWDFFSPRGMPRYDKSYPKRPIGIPEQVLPVPDPVPPPKIEVEKNGENRSDAKPIEQGYSFVGLQDIVTGQAGLEMDPRTSLEYLAMSGPLYIVTGSKPLDRKAIMRADFFRSREPSTLHESGSRESTLLFLSERSLLIGAPWEMARYSDLMTRNPGPKTKPLQSALALGSSPERHLLVAGGHLPASVRRSLQLPDVGGGMRGFAAMLPLLHTETALTLVLDKSVDLRLECQAANEISAEMALESVKSLRELAYLALEMARREAGEPFGWRLSLEKALNQGLKDSTIERKGTTVQAQLKLELDQVFFKAMTKEVVASLRQQGDRTRSVNNLKNIALAMHGYHDANKFLPPAGISNINDPAGKPLLSWRVAILPYIDQAPLYNQFDLTLPWDHPHNKKLIARMPEVYVVPGAETKEPGQTNYRVLVGPGTMFELRPGPGGRAIGWRLVEIVDGSSNTIMVVEAAEPTIWTRPDDLAYDPKGPLPKLGVTREGFNAAFGDATVRFIRSTTPVETLRAYITRAGGEAVQLPD